MSQPGGGPPPGSMAPGPPRSSLAPGLPPGMQPGPPPSLAPGQVPGLSMAPFAGGNPAQGGTSSLPIQPLNMPSGVLPGPGPANGAPRPLAPAPAPPNPAIQPLSISPLNMNPTPQPGGQGQGPGAPGGPHMGGMSAAQVLNINLLQNQSNPLMQVNAMAQQLSAVQQQQQGSLKRPADPSGANDSGPSAAKRLRSGDVDDMLSAGVPPRPPSTNLTSQPPTQMPPPSAAPTTPHILLPPSSTAPLVHAATAATAPGVATATPDLNALTAAAVAGFVGRPIPLAAAAVQAVALQQAAQAQAQAQVVAAAQAAAAARRRAAQAAAQAAVDVDDERKLLPRRGIRMALRAAGMDKDFVVDPATENALLDFYSEWISSAVSMGCEVAKRRKSNVLKARDIALHLERSWNLYIPGFGGEVLRPYRRANASELHRQRQLAVRRTAAELDHQQLQLGSGGGGGGGSLAGSGAGAGQGQAPPQAAAGGLGGSGGGAGGSGAPGGG